MVKRMLFILKDSYSSTCMYKICISYQKLKNYEQILLFKKNSSWFYLMIKGYVVK